MKRSPCDNTKMPVGFSVIATHMILSLYHDANPADGSFSSSSAIKHTCLPAQSGHGTVSSYINSQALFLYLQAVFSSSPPTVSASDREVRLSTSHTRLSAFPSSPCRLPFSPQRPVSRKFQPPGQEADCASGRSGQTIPLPQNPSRYITNHLPWRWPLAFPVTALVPWLVFQVLVYLSINQDIFTWHQDIFHDPHDHGTWAGQ